MGRRERTRRRQSSKAINSIHSRPQSLFMPQSHLRMISFIFFSLIVSVSVVILVSVLPRSRFERTCFIYMYVCVSTFCFVVIAVSLSLIPHECYTETKFELNKNVFVSLRMNLPPVSFVVS